MPERFWQTSNPKKGADVPEISGADAADADASETSPPDADVALPKKGAHEESDSKGDGKGKGKNGKKGDGKGKHKKEARIEDGGPRLMEIVLFPWCPLQSFLCHPLD